mmetsp:Transcript_5572/g.13908  ORF Transcript_5572/g.13908 Transcript_5572/m.13908 type:complete len:399 (-) Transcript_5572:283-1479(-)
MLCKEEKRAKKQRRGRGLSEPDHARRLHGLCGAPGRTLVDPLGVHEAEEGRGEEQRDQLRPRHRHRARQAARARERVPAECDPRLQAPAVVELLCDCDRKLPRAQSDKDGSGPRLASQDAPHRRELRVHALPQQLARLVVRPLLGGAAVQARRRPFGTAEGKHARGRAATDRSVEREERERCSAEAREVAAARLLELRPKEERKNGRSAEGREEDADAQPCNRRVHKLHRKLRAECSHGDTQGRLRFRGANRLGHWLHPRRRGVEHFSHEHVAKDLGRHAVSSCQMQRLRALVLHCRREPDLAEPLRSRGTLAPLHKRRTEALPPVRLGDGEILDESDVAKLVGRANDALHARGDELDTSDKKPGVVEHNSYLRVRNRLEEDVRVKAWKAQPDQPRER